LRFLFICGASVIQIIGLMIGAYIVTRMLELLIKSERFQSFVQIAAVLTLLLTVLGMFGLVMTGSSTPAIP
jgi:hypothetical protein